MEFTSYIRGKLPNYFPTLDLSTSVLTEEPFVERSTYPITKFDIRQERNPSAVEASIIVKKAPICDENIEGLTEFENMQAFRETIQSLPKNSFENRSLGYINSLDYNSELNILVSEFVQHHRLSKTILQECRYLTNKKSVASLREYLYAAGKWLRLYHKLKVNDEITLGETDFFPRLEFYISYIEGVAIDFPVMTELNEFLLKNKKQLSGLSVPLGRIHGDYGPQNIGVGTDGKLYVFDLQRNYDDCIYHDIAYFLVTLETLNPYPRYTRFNRKLLLSVGEEFLLGYRYDSAKINSWNDLHFHIYYLRCLLERIRKQSLNQKITSHGGPLNALLKKYISFTFNNKIHRELNIIERLLN